jgi:hypothetical protein
MTSLSTRLARELRGRQDGVRTVYAVARKTRHLLTWRERRRLSRAVQPDPALTIDEDAGFRMFPPDCFPEAAEVVNAAAVLANDSDALLERRRQNRARKRKEFLLNLLDLATVDRHHPLVRLALRPDLLDAVVAYMGTVPVLRSMQVLYSGPVERELMSSQLYHCDADDVRQVKIFVLCTDVTAASGPLTLLDAARSAAVRRHFRYPYDSRLTDAQVNTAIGSDPQPLEVTGPSGTVCLADTSRCFHFGSRVAAGAAPRLVAMVQLVSPFSFVLAGNWRQGAILARLAADPSLTPLQRSVLTGDVR